MSYNNPRITLTDTPIDMIMKIAEGNPGAITVLMKIMMEGEKIDPDSHPMLTIMALDTHDIYGSRVWQLYKDVCGQNLMHMLGLLRAVQLGFMPGRELSSHINGAPMADDGMEECMAKVREFLPNFAKEPA